MSRLAKYKAKGSDKSKEEWEVILKKRRKVYPGRNFIEKGLKKFKGAMVNNENLKF